jgi:hypothetical protein
MSALDNKWWKAAHQAREKLAAQMLGYPNVSMIDIGEDPDNVSGLPVLRVHVHTGDVSNLKVPESVDGIPVRIVHGDYHPQDR